MCQLRVIQYDTGPLAVLIPLTQGIAGYGTDPDGGGGGGGGGAPNLSISIGRTAPGCPTTNCCSDGPNAAAAAAAAGMDGGAGDGNTKCVGAALVSCCRTSVDGAGVWYAVASCATCLYAIPSVRGGG